MTFSAACVTVVSCRALEQTLSISARSRPVSGSGRAASSRASAALTRTAGSAGTWLVMVTSSSISARNWRMWVSALA